MLRWGAVAIVLVLAPAAVAQEPLGPALTLRLEDIPTAPIAPEVEAATFIAVVTLSCDAALARVSPTAPQDAIPVAVAFDVGEGIGIFGASHVPVDPQACLEPGATSSTTRMEYQIVIPRTTPGLQGIPAHAQARLESASPATSAVDSEPLTFQVAAAPYFLSQAKLAAKLQTCSGGHADFEVEVSNFGNVRTAYTFELASQPSGDRWGIRLPDPFVLERPSGDADSTSRTSLRVDCPGGNREGAYQIVMHSTAADDAGSTGQPLTFNLMARERSVVPAPGPALPLALAALAVAILLRRRA